MKEDIHSDKAVLITEAQNVIASLGGSFEIKTAEAYADRASALKMIKAAIERLENQRKEKLAPFRRGIEGINELFKEPIEKLQLFETQIKSRMIQFNNEQLRIQREQQRKLDEQARKEREAAMAKSAEVERKARERAEELHKQAAEATSAGQHEQAAQLIARADATVYSGLVKSLDLKEKATTVVAPVVAAQQPKVAGIATKQMPKYRITDASKINATFMKPDEDKIRKQVNALKLDAKSIIGEGIEIWMEDSIAASRKG